MLDCCANLFALSLAWRSRPALRLLITSSGRRGESSVIGLRPGPGTVFRLMLTISFPISARLSVAPQCGHFGHLLFLLLFFTSSSPSLVPDTFCSVGSTLRIYDEAPHKTSTSSLAIPPVPGSRPVRVQLFYDAIHECECPPSAKLAQ